MTATEHWERTTLGERIHARLVAGPDDIEQRGVGTPIGLVYDSTDITGRTVAVAFMGRATEHLSMANARYLRDGLTEWLETVSETSRERADRVAREEREADLKRIADEQKKAAERAAKERPK
jgi:hypothetical protein